MKAWLRARPRRTIEQPPPTFWFDCGSSSRKNGRSQKFRLRILKNRVLQIATSRQSPRSERDRKYIACLGNFSALAGASRRVFARRQAEKGHQLSSIGEAWISATTATAEGLTGKFYLGKATTHASEPIAQNSDRARSIREIPKVPIGSILGYFARRTAVRSHFLPLIDQ
jgi:hypothetical protein